MKKVSIALLLIILVSVCAVFAADETIIKWTWDMNDNDVTAFRYQINAEDPDGWRVVDASEREYSLRNVVPGESYTLYLQQSYDRLRWSPSSSSTIVASAPTETTTATPSAETTTSSVQETTNAE